MKVKDFIEVCILCDEKNRGLYSVSELYRPINRRLSAKLVPTFVDRRCLLVSTLPEDGDRILSPKHRVFF
jgi:hypothetical protein